MKFHDLAWAALLYYYKSSGDRRYVKLFRDTTFLSRLRQAPWDVPYEEFEAKVIFGFISSVGLRLPSVRGEDNLLTQITELYPSTSSLEDKSLHDCELSNEELLNSIRQIYDRFHTVPGFWLTGISKIAHVLNDALFVTINLGTSSNFGLLGETEDLIKWMRIAQKSAKEVIEEFYTMGIQGWPED